MKLSVVGLPIGNIEDISMRAIHAIEDADMVICEDTRMFSNLWSKLCQFGWAKELSVPLRFLNDFNEQRVLPKLITDISVKDKVVLVSDAGMPLISDPGYKLVRSGLELGWDIEVVPGPTAESAALSVSGLPTDKYLFLGFLPKKPGKRGRLIDGIVMVWKSVPCSVVIYEAPGRLHKLIGELATQLGSDLDVCVGIDLTKHSQKVYRGSINEIKQELSDKKIKGEVTVVLSQGK